MRTLIFLVIFARLWWTYARPNLESNNKKQFPLTVMPSMFLAEQIGKSLTMHCPVKATVARMYKYIRRIKKGQDLEYARRKLASLLGLKYKWYKDGKAIRHHRSAWFMKLVKVQDHDSGVYTCKVLTGKGGTKRNFTLSVYKQSNIGRPILQTRRRNISLKVGESLTLECVCNNTMDRPQVRWIKWHSDQRQLDERSNNIETQPRTKFPKIYDVVDSKNYGFFKISRGKARRKQKSYGFRLRLKNVKRNDTGMYTCHVWNKFGSDHVNFFTTVQPLVGVAPYSLSVKKMRNFIAWPALSSLKLKCYVNGERPLKYQWYKDGKKFLHRRLDPNINTSTWTLRLRELVRSDSGVYTCVVSNPFGVFKHNITVNVVERTRSAPILLHSFPKNISASKGDNVSFECIELVSGPLPDYRWLKWHSIPASYPKLDVQNTSQYKIISPIHYKTIRVKSGRSHRYGGRLTLNNITQDDIGLYTCRVSNHIGFDYSSGFLKMNANEGPRFLPTVYRPTVINIPATKTLTMNCNATGDPKPKVSWFKNGKSLSASDSTNGGMVISDYSLQLRKLLPQHSGNYSCNVTNSRGSVSHTFNVNIKERLFTKPIILPSAMKAIKFGQSYKLKCIIVSAEPLSVYWARKMGKPNKEAMPTERKTIKLDKFIYSYSYIIPNATIEDSGTYWCIAKNNVGVSNRKFLVQVEA